MKSTYCEYILEKILSTSEVGPILALIAPSPLTKNPLALISEKGLASKRVKEAKLPFLSVFKACFDPHWL